MVALSRQCTHLPVLPVPTMILVGIQSVNTLLHSPHNVSCQNRMGCRNRRPSTFPKTSVLEVIAMVWDITAEGASVGRLSVAAVSLLAFSSPLEGAGTGSSSLHMTDVFSPIDAFLIFK